MHYSARVLDIAPPSDDAIKSIIGMSLERAIAALFPDLSKKQAALVNAYRWR